MDKQVNGAGENFYRVRKDIDVLRRDIGKLTASLQDDAGDTAQHVGHEIAERVQELRGRVDELTTELSAKGRDVRHMTEQHIQDRPLASVVLAAAVGYFLGKLLRRPA